MKSKQTKLMVAFLLAGVIIVHSIAFNSCSGKSDEYVKSKAENTQTHITFTVPNNADWYREGFMPNSDITAPVTRITKDSLIIDTATMTKKWYRDTFYVVTLSKPKVDSLNKPILDSLKKQMYDIKYFLIPLKFKLIDFDKDPNKQ